jgi:hypothetical protein
MAQIKPIKIEDIDVSKIIVNAPFEKTYKQSGNKSKMCNITYDHGNGIIGKCIIKTPVGVAPFGISVGKEKDGEPPSKYKKYTIDINLQKDSVVYNKFREIDNKIIDSLHEKSELWWGKKVSRETISEAIYNPLIKPSSNNYPDKYRVKCPFYKGRPQFKLFDNFNKPIQWVKETGDDRDPELDWTIAGNPGEAECIYELESLMDVNKKIYSSQKAMQIRLHPPASLPDCAFDDDDDSSVNNLVVNVSNMSVSNMSVSNMSVSDASKGDASKSDESNSTPEKVIVSNTKVSDDEEEEADSEEEKSE